MNDDTVFQAAYDEVLRNWPDGVTALDVPTPYGSTRVHVCGPEDGTPLVLLPGGGTTSMAWYANAAGQEDQGSAVLGAADVHPGAAVRGGHVDGGHPVRPVAQNLVVRRLENRLVAHAPAL